MVDSLNAPKPVEGRHRRRAALSALTALTTVAASLLLAEPAFAAGSAVAGILEDGSAVYDDEDGPGRDSNGSNGLVRRGDTVVYDFQYNYDGAGTTDPVIRSELPVGMQWTTVPVDCSRAGSAITAGPNGPATVLACNLPSTPAAVSGRVTPIARMLATTPSNTNGAIRTVGFTLSDAAGPTAVSNTVDVTISADPNPYFDLAMTSLIPNRVGPIINGPNGPEQSTIATFYFNVALARPYPYTTAGDTVRGVEPLASTITFTDDLSTMPPFAVVTRCAGVGSTSAGPNSGGGGINGVTNSGAFVCSPTGSVTITNADTTVGHFPRNYAPPPKVISQSMDVAVPNSVIRAGVDGIAGTADDGSYPFTHRFTNFDPNSPAGVSNFADGTEPTANNQLNGTFIIPVGIGGIRKTYGSTTFDRRVSPGATLTASIQSLNTNITVQNQTICDVFDHTAYQLGAIPTHESGTDTFVIEYGHPAAYPASTAQLANANCGDADATWSADPTDPALTGGLTSDGFRDGIDRVRVRWIGPATPNLDTLTRVVVRVLGKSEYGGTSLVNRAVKNANGTISRAQDIATWTQVNLGINKSSIPQSAGTGNRYSAGFTIPFTINPSIARPRSGNAPATPISGLTVTDILPTNEPRIAVAPGTANSPAGVTAIEYCKVCDGTDWSDVPLSPSYGIRWFFEPRVPGTALPQLTFRALSQVETPTNTTYINNATISVDPSAEAAPATVNYPVIVDAPATVLASKASNTAVIPVGGTFSHQLSVRNNTTNTLDHLDVIDVLPFVADGRTPASAFAGGYSSVALDGLPAGLTAYVTSAAPSALDSADGTVDGYADPLNPGDARYSAPGTGTWSCTLAQLGTAGCPSAAQVTGIRFAADSPGIFPLNTTFSWAILLGTAGNAGGNIYTNRFVGRVDRTELALPIISPDASTLVVVPRVAVTKDGCVTACDPTTGAGFSNTVTVPDGGQATVRLNVDNTGNEPGTVVVNDVLPQGVTVVPGTADASHGSVGGFPNTWDVGPLGEGENATLTFNVKATSPVVGPGSTTATITDQFGQTASASPDVPFTIVAVTPEIGLVKSITASADLDNNGFIGPGDRIDYAFRVSNTGTVDFATITVDDPLIPGVICPGGGLAAGAEATCTGSYTVTDADLTAGSVENTATATGTPANGSPFTSGPSTATRAVAAPRPAITLVKSASAAQFDRVGQSVVYSFRVTNTGNVAVSDLEIAETVFTGSGALNAVACPTTTLAPLAVVVCTAEYTVTQADLDRGSVDNTAVASVEAAGAGPRVASAPSSVSITAVVTTGITLVKSIAGTADLNNDGFADTGDRIDYEFLVTNTGTVTLGTITVADPLVPAVDCPAGGLAPAASATCTGSYIVTDADLAAGSVANTATATGTPATGTPATSDPSTATQPLDSPRPAISLVKSASLAEFTVVDQRVVYSFLVTNTGNVDVSGLTITESVFTGSGTLAAIDCPTTTLAPQEAVTCTAEYLVTQADIDRASVDNTAAATGDSPAGVADVTSGPSSVSLVAPPTTRALRLAMASRIVDTNGNGITDEGDAVIWTVTATNDGTAALTDLVVEDGSPGSLVCPETALAPGESMDCESPAQPITAADVAAGILSNTASATARDLVGTAVVADPAAAAVPLEPAPPAPPATSSPATGTLSATGLDTGGASFAAAMLFLLGAGLLVLRRRA